MAPLHISAKGSFQAMQNPSPVGAVFADVEVDTETGEVKILKLVLAHDCG